MVRFGDLVLAVPGIVVLLMVVAIFPGSDIATMVTPSLTTVRRPLQQMAGAAASQLLALGCSTGQGYFFSKPIAAHETNELLRTMRGAPPMQTGPNLEIVRVS